MLMGSEEHSKLKCLLGEAIEASRKSHSALLTLTEEEERIFGFNHNDEDMDDLIDSIDYGDGIPFGSYLKRMTEHKRGR